MSAMTARDFVPMKAISLRSCLVLKGGTNALAHALIRNRSMCPIVHIEDRHHDPSLLTNAPTMTVSTGRALTTAY
jgi:hypothetical protein